MRVYVVMGRCFTIAPSYRLSVNVYFQRGTTSFLWCDPQGGMQRNHGCIDSPAQCVLGPAASGAADVGCVNRSRLFPSGWHVGNVKVGEKK